MSQGHRAGDERQESASGDDEGALVRAAQHDVAAFGPLCARYQDRIYSYLRTRTGQVEDADLTQQVYVQALDALPYDRTQGVPVAAWLFRNARNVATDWQWRQRATVSWEAAPETVHACAPDTADGGLLRRDAFAPLYALLAGPDAQTREALILASRPNASWARSVRCSARARTLRANRSPVPCTP